MAVEQAATRSQTGELTLMPRGKLTGGGRKDGRDKIGPFWSYTSDMYVTVYHVNCKTKKCAETIPIDKTLPPDETWELKCRRGHVNKYDRSCIESRTAKAWKGSGLKAWR